MQQPGRSYSAGSGYRYGFNGKEDDPETKTQDYGMRIYDARLGRFLSVDPLTKDYPMLTPYQFASNRPIDGIDLDGLEYVSFHHYANGEIGQKMHYKSTDKDIEKIGGTTKGRYNSASYGPLGKGVVHYFYNADGKLDPLKTTWEQKQEDLETDVTFHGLYSGPGSVTKDGLPNSTSYNFDLQAIDWADAIAKRHDKDYVDATKTGEPYAGFLEDIRTVQADRDMVARVDQLLGGALNPFVKKNKVEGVETPFRTSTSGEMLAAASGQLILINALAVYKQWKIDKEYTDFKKHTYLKLRDKFAKDHPTIDKIIMKTVKPKK
jgi:RHS repeat-associated protein